MNQITQAEFEGRAKLARRLTRRYRHPLPDLCGLRFAIVDAFWSVMSLDRGLINVHDFGIWNREPMELAFAATLAHVGVSGVASEDVYLEFHAAESRAAKALTSLAVVSAWTVTAVDEGIGCGVEVDHDDFVTVFARGDAELRALDQVALHHLRA